MANQVIIPKKIIDSSCHSSGELNLGNYRKYRVVDQRQGASCRDGSKGCNAGVNPLPLIALFNCQKFAQSFSTVFLVFELAEEHLLDVQSYRKKEPT